MSGLGTMVLTLLLLVFMVTSHQDGGKKQATQRNAVNIRRRKSITQRTTDEKCNEYCEERDRNCCGKANGEPRCARMCFG
uniref:Conotoxin LiCr173 n=1 Tax=Conus lividus TaxID=89426 RepID=O373_CONLI|nr:RecName: Full=Conotoxin LiCr173; Flags: Precursor [Conus lividus]AAZ83779.2 LiCr173P [Conus lividus]